MVYFAVVIRERDVIHISSVLQSGALAAHLAKVKYQHHKQHSHFIKPKEKEPYLT